MATIIKKLLSESSFGKNILISGTGIYERTTIHQAVAGATNLDEIYLYAYNSKEDDVELTTYWGETGVSGEMRVTIPYQAGRYMIVDGKVLQNGLSVTAFCSSGNGINVDGYVNRFVY